MTISVNTNFTANNNYKQKKVGGYGAHIASLGTAFGISMLGMKCAERFGDKFLTITDLPDEQVKIVHKAGEKMLKEVGLADKVKIKYYPKTSPKIKTLKDMLKVMTNPTVQVKAGVNACFAPKPLKDIITKQVLEEGNTILMPEKNLALSIFHEIGHAMNWHTSKLGKMRIMTCGFAKALPLCLALYASLSRKSKPDNDGKFTKGQKFNNFIRNNAGVLSLIGFSPLLIEEWKATSNGKKYAQKLLSPELLKKYTKGQNNAYMTYVVTAVFGALSAHAAVKIKDKIIEKKEAKLATA